MPAITFADIKDRFEAQSVWRHCRRADSQEHHLPGSLDGKKTIIRDVNNATNAIVPTADNMNGNFSITESDHSHQQSVYTHTPFASNASIGPVSTVAKNMSALLLLWPAGSTGGTEDLWHARASEFQRVRRQVRSRSFRGRDHLFARVYINKYKHAPTYDREKSAYGGAWLSGARTKWVGCRLHMRSSRRRW